MDNHHHHNHSQMTMDTTTMVMSHAGHDHDSSHDLMSHDSMGSHSMGDMDMKMYFHDGFSETVLFKSCYIQSAGAMVGACFAMFFLAVLYEGLKFLREIFLQRSLLAGSQITYTVDKLPAGSSQEQMVMETRNPSITSRMLTGSHFLQTILHIVQVFISYCLMLVFMTYNVWLCLSIILGAGVGYFLFGWKRAAVVDSNEHCH